MTWYSSGREVKAQDTGRRLYHANVGIPASAQTQFGEILLDYSRHALEAAIDDKYGNIVNLPRTLDTSKAKVIEVEMMGNKTTKVLYVIPYNDDYDLSIVLMPDRRLVKTIWLNHKTDRHSTLDTSRYDTPPAPLNMPENLTHMNMNEIPNAKAEAVSL